MNLEGSTCIVTGASQGLGKCTALGLARMGADVVLISRDPGRAEEAREEIVRESGNERVECVIGDLSSQASVREMAARIQAREGPLKVLVNNAGVATPQRQVTEDGLELQFAVNHLAPFLLTNLLRDRLVADAPSRVVTVASLVHERGQIDLDDLQGEVGYTGSRAYDQSKLANVLFTFELSRRLEGTGVTANCLHPGVAPTSLNNYLRGPRRANVARPGAGVRAVRMLRARWNKLLGRARVNTAEEASRTSLYLASAPDVDGTTGKYFVACREAQPSPASLDEELAARLWAVSEELTGLATINRPDTPGL